MRKNVGTPGKDWNIDKNAQLLNIDLIQIGIVTVCTSTNLMNLKF